MARHTGSIRHCVVCICGRPLSGKTTASRMLRDAHGWPVEEASTIGDRTLDQRAQLRNRSRFSYPESAQAEWEQPDRFAACLQEVIGSASSPVVIVGLRRSATLRWLRARYPRRVCVVYLAVGVRVCQERFARVARQPQNAYRGLLEFAIESDQDAIRRMAQVVITNHSSLSSLQSRLLRIVGADGRAHRTPLERCSCCGEVRPVHHRARTDQAPLCRGCYECRFNSEPCSRCHELRPVHLRDASRDPICKRCYQRTCNVQVCACCGRPQTVSRRNLDGDPLCKDCSRHGAATRPSSPAPSPARTGRRSGAPPSREIAGASRGSPRRRPGP
jgi:hypothetical protein